MTTLTVGQLLAAAAICDCSGKGQSRRIADALTAEARRLHAEAGTACYIDLPLSESDAQPGRVSPRTRTQTDSAAPNEEESCS